MAHMIEERNGVFSFVENGKQERAWHNLGQVYDIPLTAIEALEGSHANFDVEAREMYFMSPEFNNLLAKGDDVPVQVLRELLHRIDGKQANVRTDVEECLGVVSDSYGIVQNKHAFDFVDVLTTGELGGETPTIECAGVLGKGERVFITAKFPEPVRLLNKSNDPVDMYVVFTTSHDGSGAVTCMVTPVRVVCNNTLNLAFSNNSGKLCLRHTVNIMNRLDLTDKLNAKMAYSALNLYNTYKSCFEEKLNALADVRLRDKEIEKTLVHSLLSDEVCKIYDLTGNMNHEDIPTRSKNLINNVTDAMHTGIGQGNLEKGTGLWFVNGLTTYYQNENKWNDDTKKFDAIMDGSVQKKLQKAYTLLAA